MCVSAFEPVQDALNQSMLIFCNSFPFIYVCWHKDTYVIIGAARNVEWKLNARNWFQQG